MNSWQNYFRARRYKVKIKESMIIYEYFYSHSKAETIVTESDIYGGF